jgi:phosphate transport system permease protein
MTTATSSLIGAQSLQQSRLPRWAVPAVAVGIAGVMLLLFAVTPMQGVADYLVAATAAIVVTISLISLAVEGRRRAVDRLATNAALLALGLTLLPLAFVIGYTIKRGLHRFSAGFLTHSMAGVGPLSPAGGVYHAIIGTVEQVLLASIIAVPLGLLVAIYITEYGRNALGTAIRFLIDVMTGIPSIVAGLFILSFWIIALNQPFTGFAGSLALAILELPIIVRSAEEMITLVPGELREASYALGIAKWKTILRVVLPTAASGITTGIMLAVARVTGETAPVLLVAGNNNFINNNPFKGGQADLPLFIFSGARSASTFNVDRAWAAALTLIAIVVLLYVAARLVTRRSSVRR